MIGGSQPKKRNASGVEHAVRSPQPKRHLPGADALFIFMGAESAVNRNGLPTFPVDRRIGFKTNFFAVTQQAAAPTIHEHEVQSAKKIG